MAPRHDDDGGSTPEPTNKPTHKPTKEPTKDDDDTKKDDSTDDTSGEGDDAFEHTHAPSPASDDYLDITHSPTPSTYTPPPSPSTVIQPPSNQVPTLQVPTQVMYPTMYPTATSKPTKKPTESPTKKSNDDDNKEEDDDDKKKDDDDKKKDDDEDVEVTDDHESNDDLFTPSPTPFIMNPATTYNPTPTDLYPTSHSFAPTPRDYTGEPSFVPTPTFLFHSPPPSTAQLTFPPTFNPTSMPVKTTYAPTPELAPTFAPTAAVIVTSTAAWYQTTAFIVSISLLGIFLLCVGVFNFYWSRKAIGPDPSGRGPVGKIDAKTFIHMSPNDDVENVYSEATEETSLLKGKGGFSPFPTTAALTSAVSPSSRIYFRASDLGGGAENDAALFPRFQSILSTGIVTNLHTTKGPKPVVLSMVGNEVRWQAVKTAQKRYKLNLRDVISVEIGKQTSNFVKSRIADDDLCFSLVTQKTTLDLEANNKVERDSLVRGFQIALDSLRKSNY